MRIVGGAMRGRALPASVAAGTRPTSDRLREAIFNVLAHGHDDACKGARVLDLYAGTGAMGLEALSRGARFAVLVDLSAAARGAMRANVEALGCAGTARIFRRDATKLGNVAPNEPFSLVFCDPPYGEGLVKPALQSALSGGWLVPGALVVVEAEAGAADLLPEGFEELDSRLYGETQVVFARVAC
jgi:16S rRNA (guanine966-N2)-methyltransferase